MCGLHNLVNVVLNELNSETVAVLATADYSMRLIKVSSDRCLLDSCLGFDYYDLQTVNRNENFA